MTNRRGREKTADELRRDYDESYTKTYHVRRIALEAIARLAELESAVPVDPWRYKGAGWTPKTLPEHSAVDGAPSVEYWSKLKMHRYGKFVDDWFESPFGSMNPEQVAAWRYVKPPPGLFDAPTDTVDAGGKPKETIYDGLDYPGMGTIAEIEEWERGKDGAA